MGMRDTKVAQGVYQGCSKQQEYTVDGVDTDMSARSRGVVMYNEW